MPRSSSGADGEPVDKSVGDVDNLPKNSRVLGIFAKEPLPGRVKTRLSPPLSAAQAATLYQTALLETVAMAAGGAFDLVLCYAGSESYFRQTFPGISLCPQQGADLGARMSNALRHFFAQGYRQALLIGSDSPDLPLAMVEQAFAALDRQQLVLIPARDGGYVLIGESCHHPHLFERMPWSSAEVTALTRKRAAAAGIACRLLPVWDDLDDLEALQRLLQRSPASRTAAYLRSLSVPECSTASP